METDGEADPAEAFSMQEKELDEILAEEGVDGPDIGADDTAGYKSMTVGNRFTVPSVNQTNPLACTENLRNRWLSHIRFDHHGLLRTPCSRVDWRNLSSSYLLNILRRSS